MAKLAPDARRILCATYLGGSDIEFAEHRPWLMPDGSMLLAGFCGSRGFPTTPGAYQRKLHGPGDGFLAKLSPDGTQFVFSTLLGGCGGENLLMPTVDTHGNIWVVGNTGSRDFPVTPEALQKTPGGGTGDAFVVKLEAADNLRRNPIGADQNLEARAIKAKAVPSCVMKCLLSLLAERVYQRPLAR
jgi:hypothetical protein